MAASLQDCREIGRRREGDCRQNRRLTGAPTQTVAEGLATASGYELTQSILWDLLDDFLLVSDKELMESISTLIEKAHTLAEAAGAAALAGALKYIENIKGKKVALIISGGNITLEQLKNVVLTHGGSSANPEESP